MSFAVPCLQVCVNVYVGKKGMIVAIRGRHVRCVRNYVLEMNEEKREMDGQFYKAQPHDSTIMLGKVRCLMTLFSSE